MVGRLLWRGMLLGLLAGILSFGFLKLYGEPAVERAIAFEKQMDEAKAHAHSHTHAGGEEAQAAGAPAPHEEPEEELFSRSTQSGIGLFTGVGTYSIAFGGLFALAFALAYARMGLSGPRAAALLLAALGFVALYLVPSLKYPANPPSVGDPGTIGLRTGLYFGMMLASLVAMITAGRLRLVLLPHLGRWEAAIAAAAFYLAAALAAGLILPAVDEVPAAFPAAVLWQFRVASTGSQLILWSVLGLGFGIAAEWAMAGRRASAPA